MLHNVCDTFVHVYAFLLMSTSAVRPGLEPTIPVVLSESTSKDPACRKLKAEAREKQKLAAKNANKKFPVTASALAFVQPWCAMSGKMQEQQAEFWTLKRFIALEASCTRSFTILSRCARKHSQVR